MDKQANKSRNIMLTTTPYLRIRRPSPTAAEFTVTTLPHLTPALRISLYAIYLVRMLLSCLILLFLYAIWAENPYGSTPPKPSTSSSVFPGTRNSSLSYIQRALRALLSSPPGTLATHLASKISNITSTSSAISISSSSFSGNATNTTISARGTYLLVVLLSLAALYILTQRLHTEESLLVLRGLGIQTSSSKGNILAGRATTRFIPTEKIQDVLINEAFHGFGVRYYLVVVVDGEKDVVVVFPKLLPRVDVVEKVWRGVRECLYERKSTGSSLSPGLVGLGKAKRAVDGD
jgi:phosphatidylinositol N-acetylglucosaminyltransferase subunit H